MKKLFWFVFLPCVALFLCSADANAAVLGDLAGLVQNELEDDDFETFVNAGGTIEAPGASTVLDVGDYLVAMFRITSLRVPPGGPQVKTYADTAAAFTGIVVTKIGAKTIPVGGGAPDGVNDVSYKFVPATMAEWAAIGIPAHLIPTSDSTMVIFYDDPDNIKQSAGGGIVTKTDALATVSGTRLWEFGGAVVGGPASAPVWNAASDTDDLATSFAVGTTGSFSANLNMTALNGGIELIPTPTGVGSFDVLLRNGSFGSPSPGSLFPVSSDVDAILTPTPEPASILAWSGLLVGMGLTRLRRRKRAN